MSEKAWSAAVRQWDASHRWCGDARSSTRARSYEVSQLIKSCAFWHPHAICPTSSSVQYTHSRRQPPASYYHQVNYLCPTIRK